MHYFLKSKKLKIYIYKKKKPGPVLAGLVSQTLGSNKHAWTMLLWT